MNRSNARNWCSPSGIGEESSTAEYPDKPWHQMCKSDISFRHGTLVTGERNTRKRTGGDSNVTRSVGGETGR